MSSVLPVVESERCTGHCCKEFTLPYSPEELEARKGSIYEGEKIVAMVIYLGFGRWTLPRIADAEKIKREEKGEHHLYTCKHLLPNGDCGNYADRPSLCTDYPYEGTCGWLDCTRKTS